MPLRPQPRVRESLSVAKLFEAVRETLKMVVVAGEKGLSRPIKDKAINRPALAVTGYFRSFAAKRVQLFGAGEMSYLRDISEDEQHKVFREMLDRIVPVIVVSRNLAPTPAMVALCEAEGVPLLRSPLPTRDVANTLTIVLDQQFAPRVSEHGTLLDVKGIGTLIRGDSGVGKSECALALIERGHSLVADDMVHITLVNETDLSGQSNPLNRGYMECRGIGIINIAELFGIRAVRREKDINLVVTFHVWHQGLDEERTGLEQESYKILGQQVPHVVLPVRPGRDLARLVEVAAMVQALKTMGHDSAKEFNDRLIAAMGGDQGA